MNAFFKAALVAAALVTTSSVTAQAASTDLAVARELAALKTTLHELEQTANEDARYVLPLRTNAQLARLSAECVNRGGSPEQTNPICEPLSDMETTGPEPELMSF